MNELFTDKYSPKSIKEYVGFSHQSALQYVERVLKGTEKKKGIIFFGPPGCGKSVLANLLPDHFDLSFSYSNASDSRNKKNINVDILRTESLQSKKSIIIIDECDGLSKSGFKELERVMKKYEQPIVLIANDITKIPYSIKKLCAMEKFDIDHFSMLALAKKVVKLEEIAISTEEIKTIVSHSKSYRDILHKLQFTDVDDHPPEQLSADTAVLRCLQNQSTGQFPTTDLPDLIIRMNDNSASPNLISMASLWEARYRSGYTYGKHVVTAILSSIRNPKIKKLKYPRTYALIHTAKTGKRAKVETTEGKKSNAPKIRILGFK